MKLGIRDFADVIAALKGPGGGNISAAEKRRAARIEVSAKVNIHLVEGTKIAKTFSALARDISLTGIGVLQTTALGVNQTVVIALPRQHSPLFVCCTVMQCRPLADGLLVVGLDFAEVASKETADLLLNDGQRQAARIQESVLG
jgi:c-di-GMP-binding flagellar brake protein YcgR